jgi:hypothetical protein
VSDVWLPVEVVIEVEQLAEQLTVLGSDARHTGDGPVQGGGLRNLPLFGGLGLMWFLPYERDQLIVIARITWPGWPVPRK